MATWVDLMETERAAVRAREALGAELRAWREAAGLTLAQVGERIGRDQSAVYKAEEGALGGRVGREYAHEAGMLDRWLALPPRPPTPTRNAAAQRALAEGAK